MGKADRKCLGGSSRQWRRSAAVAATHVRPRPRCAAAVKRTWAAEAGAGAAEAKRARAGRRAPPPASSAAERARTQAPATARRCQADADPAACRSKRAHRRRIGGTGSLPLVASTHAASSGVLIMCCRMWAAIFNRSSCERQCSAGGRGSEGAAGRRANVHRQPVAGWKTWIEGNIVRCAAHNAERRRHRPISAEAETGSQCGRQTDRGDGRGARQLSGRQRGATCYLPSTETVLASLGTPWEDSRTSMYLQAQRQAWHW